MTHDLRVGVLYPDTRGSGEDDYHALAGRIDGSMRIDLSYVAWPDEHANAHELDAAGKLRVLRGLGDDSRLLAAADRLRSAAPHVVSWTCSSGSFLHGLLGARRQARLIGERLGIPATSTSLAYVEALAALGITTVGLGSVYHPTVTDAFVAFLADAGIQTVRRIDLDARSDRELASWGPGRLTDIVDATNTDAAEAILIPETALHTTAHVDHLEARAGKPVLTATPVTLWHCLDLVGCNVHRDGLGTLLRDGRVDR